MAYYRDCTGKFKKDSSDSDKYLDIFEEFDFSCIHYDECDFFCPECRNMLRCEAYGEVKEAWETFYM